MKPENILLDAGGRLKISDFGLCAVYKLDEGGKMKTRLLSENCGSKPYVAPEVCQTSWYFGSAESLTQTLQLGSGKPYEAEPIDVWGLGVILFTMLSGSESIAVSAQFVGPHFARHALGRTIRRESRVSIVYIR